MGRGNICVSGEYEGLYYLDREHIDIYENTSDADAEPLAGINLQKLGIEYSSIKYSYNGKGWQWQYSEALSSLEYDNMLETMEDYFLGRFTSFYKTNYWKDEFHIILKNSYFCLGVADNQWSFAWALLENDNLWGVPQERNLMSKHYRQYLGGIKDALLETYGECYCYGGAWVCGQRLTR